MSASPPIIINSIEVESSSGSEQIRTPTSTGAARSTYSRQHNVTPTPEPTIIRIQEGVRELRLSGSQVSDTEDEEDDIDDLAADIDGLEVSDNGSLDNDDNDPVYRLRGENLPDAPIYDSRLQSALRDTKARLGQLYSSLETCPLLLEPASTIFALGQQMQQLSEFDYPRTRTIGLVGDSGVGKSSLINSLLDESGIARSSGDGGACTNIVTEYRYLSRTHAENYYFEVDYMTPDEIKILLEDLISTYRAFYTESYRDIQSVSEQADVRERAQRAAVALHSLFGGYDEYSEESMAREGPNASEDILKELEGMVKNVQRERPGGLETSTWRRSANTIEDLENQLDVFIRVTSQDDIPILWPFVGMIRVYLKSVFLRTGIIVADLPGLRDLNYARVRATDRYMRTCHEVFIVTRIDRATTDDGVRDIVNRFSQRPIRIVCTHSEAVNARETEISSREDAPAIKRLRSAVESLTVEKRRLQNARRNNRNTRSNAEEELRISDELERARFNLDSFLVRRRNARVQNSLQADYAPQVFKNDLQVFCVSNKEYSYNRDEEITMAQPRVELSGIPALRKYCQLIPAKVQFDAVAAFLDHQVPSLLGSIRQWLLQGSDGLSAERASTLRAALTGSRRNFLQCSALVTRLERILKDDFRATILNRIEASAVAWSQEAMDTSWDWRGWHSSTYKTFCLHYGDYHTAAAGYRNWNDEIVTTMREDLSPNWIDFIQQAHQRIDKTVEKIEKIFELEERALDECREMAPNAIENLLENMTPRMNCILDLIETATESFMEKVRIIQSNTLEGHPSSYTATLMRPAYLAAQREFGNGSHARRNAHIQNRLSRPDLFLSLRSQSREEQKGAVTALIEKIQQGLQTEVGRLLVDIRNVVADEGQVSESRQYPGTARSVQRLVDELTRELVGRHDLISHLRERR